MTGRARPALVVAGESLIDLAPRGGSLLPLPGGSPLNVAVGLARLGTTTAYLGRLSTDGFGRRLRTLLDAEGVDLRWCATTDDPTTLAVVHLDDDGGATYGFYLAGTSSGGLRRADLPALPAGAALHVSLGAVTLATAPAGHATASLLDRERGRRVVSLDPNVRSSVVDDPVEHAARLAEAVAACDLVKVSDEDLAVLHPSEDPLEIAARWRAGGPALVVVTRGADGAVALGPHGGVEVPGEPVAVADTVGAGDAFTAGLLGWLADRGLLERRRLDGLDARQTTLALRHAARVAAVTCERVGADPPRADELPG